MNGLGYQMGSKFCKEGVHLHLLNAVSHPEMGPLWAPQGGVEVIPLMLGGPLYVCVCIYHCVIFLKKYSHLSKFLLTKTLFQHKIIFFIIVKALCHLSSSAL